MTAKAHAHQAGVELAGAMEAIDRLDDNDQVVIDAIGRLDRARSAILHARAMLTERVKPRPRGNPWA